MRKHRTQRRALLVAVTAAALAASGFLPGRAQPRASSAVPGQALVRFRPGAPAPAVSDALRGIGARADRAIPGIGWRLVRFRRSLPVAEALRSLLDHPAVASAEPNHTGSVALTPNDPCFTGCIGAARQWNLRAVNALLGWDLAPARFFSAAEKAGLSPIKVAVLDTKIDESHPDWVNASPTPVENGNDARFGGQLDLAEQAHFIDPLYWGVGTGAAYYHGTFVAGILGASANNGASVAGLGYHAQIVPVTVVDGSGNTNAAAVAAGIMWAKQVGARVINLSLGLSGDSAAVQDAINRATFDAPGALVVAAAGNNGNDQPFYPAWNDNVMAVAAVDEADRRGACSNFNARVSVAAPGVGVVSLDPSKADRVSIAPCGTSTAAPHVSALAALLFAQDPARTPEEVREIIEGSADEDRFLPGRDDLYGHGRVNYERALSGGEGPFVNGVSSTFPAWSGGTSRATATAAAASTSGAAIAGAELWMDTPGAPGSGIAMRAADGAFDSNREVLEADILVYPSGPNMLTTGVHRLFVRAYDGTRWGPASVGVLIADRRRPEISDLKADPGIVPAKPVQISFRVTDDWATEATYSFRLARYGSPDVVHESQVATMGVPGTARVAWSAELAQLGVYTLTLTVRDQALNTQTAQTTVVVA